MTDEPAIDIDTTTLAIAILFAIIVGALLSAVLGALLGRPTPDWLKTVLFVGLLVGGYWAKSRR